MPNTLCRSSPHTDARKSRAPLAHLPLCARARIRACVCRVLQEADVDLLAGHVRAARQLRRQAHRDADGHPAGGAVRAAQRHGHAHVRRGVYRLGGGRCGRSQKAYLSKIGFFCPSRRCPEGARTTWESQYMPHSATPSGIYSERDEREARNVLLLPLRAICPSGAILAL